MKEQKCCPKCRGTEIYTDAGLPKQGDRTTIAIASWSRLLLDVYICAACGFTEEYVREKDLQSESHMKKLRANWKIHR